MRPGWEWLRDEAIELAPLALALLGADRALIACRVPGWAELAVLVLASQVAALRPAGADPWRGFAARLPWVGFVSAAAAALFRLGLDLPWASLTFLPLWLGFEAAYCLGWAGREDAWRARWERMSPGGRESLRRIALAAAGLFLMRGYLRATLLGGGDSNWYAVMLADMIAQTRHGIFPVWAGQSIYQFNGAIYPLRIAPAFHYLGAALDWLTLHSLGIFALQNTLITLLGVAAVFTAYFTLAALLPRRRGLAAGLSILFLACPGTVGLPYVADLFMSWTTAPLLPLVWFATVRSFQDGGRPRTLLLLGASLGACWWGHSPIALWASLLAGAAQLVRLATGPRGAWLPALAGVVAFAATAAYPVGSVLLFPPERAVKAYDFQAASPENIVLFIRQAFPSVLLPVSHLARRLGDFQLGWSLWALLLLGLGQWRRCRAPEFRTLLAASVLLLVLLTPIPGLDLALWRAVPAWIRNPTANWVMNRLYLILSGLVVYAIAAGAARGAFQTPRRRRLLALAVGVGCVWSLAEASRFARSPVAAARPAASATDLLRPENVNISRFAYLVFPHEPGYFVDGAVDPELENRLRQGPDGPVLAGGPEAARAAASEIGRSGFRPDPTGRFLQSSVPFRLQPGRRYLLEFDFAHPARTSGELDVLGQTLRRVYALPTAGQAEGFGAGGRHSRILSIWTSNPAGETIGLRFVPSRPRDGAGELPLLGTVSLLAYDPARLPVRVASWMPYRALVASPGAAWLETPRMYQDGYVARVGGRRVPIRKSDQGLVAVPVPAGRSEVSLRYEPPAGLQALFWISAGSLAACLLLAAAETIRQGLRPAAN